MKLKFETFGILLQFKRMVKNQFQTKVKENVNLIGVANFELSKMF